MKRQWLEKEISNFLGIATAKAIPQLNECVECKNLDLRENTGELVLRSGYAQKYAAPTHASLSSLTYLAFENFFIPDIGWDTTKLEAGREVTCQVVKATVEPVSGSGVTTHKNILAFFVRPYWKKLIDGAAIAAASTSTEIKVASTTATTDQYKNCYLRISATTDTPTSRHSGHFRKILSHTTGTNTTITFTIEELPYTPLSAAGNNFEIWGWSDAWNWLNEMIITKITAINVGSEPQRMDLYLQSNGTNSYVGWTIYNITKDEFSLITYDNDVTVATEICITDYSNSWDADDEVILCPNWIPLQYLEQMYYTARSEVATHKVINDLRIGFGGQRNRLGVSIGFRNKNFQITMAGTHPTITGQQNPAVLGGINRIVLDPYNATADTEWISISDSSDDNSTGTYADFPNKKYSYYIGVLLDDQSWNIVAQGDVTPNNHNRLIITINILNGLFNKRITHFAVFLSEGDDNPYFLVNTRDSGDHIKDEIVSLLDPDYDEPYWIFDANGYSSRIVYIRYTDFQNNAGEMPDVIGFVPTMIYVKSWDAALVATNKVFIANPYSDYRWENKIFFSPISGDGVIQYDTLIGNKYLDVENVSNEGNEIIGLGLLANLDLAVLKRNSFEKRDSETGALFYRGIGEGTTSRRSIARGGELLYWASEYDILTHNSQQVINLSEGTIRDTYRALSASVKNALIATNEEKDNSYRLFNGTVEYVLTKKGWIKQDRYNDPDCYSQTRDGSVWFMNTGIIYYDNAGVKDNAQDISFEWKSVPIDIARLGEQMPDLVRFHVNKIWLRYTSDVNLTMKIFKEGSGTEYQSKAFSSSLKYGVMRLKPGFNCRDFQIQITGSTSGLSSPTNGVRIISAGVIFAPMRVGVWSN